MATRQGLMVSSTALVLAGILMAMIGLLQAREMMDLPFSPYASLAGACLCLIAAVVLGIQMARKTPLEKSKF